MLTILLKELAPGSEYKMAPSNAAPIGSFCGSFGYVAEVDGQLVVDESRSRHPLVFETPVHLKRRLRRRGLVEFCDAIDQ